jgi:hypothetical protein
MSNPITRLVLEMLLSHRKTLVDTVADLPIELINKIPEGFNNNILWNVGHMISVQQLIAYGLSDQEYVVEEAIVMAYRKNTKPEAEITSDGFQSLCNILIESTNSFINDYRDEHFLGFKPFIAKSINMTYNSIDEVIPFILYHDALHATVISTYKRILRC